MIFCFLRRSPKSSLLLQGRRQNLVLIVTMGTDGLWPMVTGAKGICSMKQGDDTPLSQWGHIRVCQAERMKRSDTNKFGGVGLFKLPEY